MMDDISGVYQIKNKINNKRYIGSSIHIQKRFSEHKYGLNNGTHVNSHLQKSWDKYGEHNFEFSIIEEVNGEYNKLLNAEQKWIDYYQSYNPNNGYNISHYAIGSGGYEVSEETKEKLRQARIGRKLSEETKQLLSKQRRGALNQFYGKHHTEEAKEKIRKAQLGHKSNENQLNALKLGRGNRYHTEETYRKLSIARQGEKSSNAKLKENEVIDILKQLKNGKSEKTLSEKYGVQISQISRIKNRQRWGYLYEKYPELYP